MNFIFLSKIIKKKILLKSLYFIAFLFFVLILVNLFSFTENKSEKNNHFSNNKVFSVYPVMIPDSIDFAGEIVPIENFDIYESLDKEFTINTYWQSQMLMYFKRSTRYFPVIEKILKKNNIPDDFKYLAMAESGLTNTISPSNAVGFWQFVKSTAITYGLEVNEDIDERYNIEKSTEAACRFFEEAYSIYKSWTLVAASFNFGTNGLSRSIEKQKIHNYYDLLLNDETSRYVFRVLAYKTIMSHPEKYGFILNKKDFYPPIPVNVLRVDSSITDLTSFAFSKSINYKILKMFNPWLRQSSLINKNKKTYYLKIPKGNYRNLKFLQEEFLNDNIKTNDTTK
jgi:membrane-bound lytic murein transglycosylase D